jgi:hypothetical protein
VQFLFVGEIILLLLSSYDDDDLIFYDLSVLSAFSSSHFMTCLFSQPSPVHIL